MSGKKEREERTNEYWVRLTELEMAAVAKCLAGFFNFMAGAKKGVDPAVAEHVSRALHKMKFSADNKVTQAAQLDPKVIVIPQAIL